MSQPHKDEAWTSADLDVDDGAPVLPKSGPGVTAGGPARAAALAALHRVFTQGAFASAAIRAEIVHKNVQDSRDRALVTELVYGTIRRKTQLDRALSKLGKRLKDLNPKIHDVLRMAAYALIFLDRVPEHAVVDAAVDQARQRGGEKAAGQTNAILRKLTALPREKRLPNPPDILDPLAHVASATSLSRDLASLLMDQLGLEGAKQFGVACLDRPPLVLRANLLKTTREALIAEVEGSAGHHARAVVLGDRLGLLPAELAAVREGRATVQDEGSMAVIDLLDPKPGEVILDLCSSPGGKTTMIAEVMGDVGRVVASDRNRDKLERVRGNAERLGLCSVELCDPAPGPRPIFDRVLVDAPCSGLGTLRRHPEIRERLSSDDLPRLVAAQRNLLRKGAERVRPGGVLVYAVCSILPAEGSKLVEDLPGFEVLESVTTSPSDPGSPDGFFARKWLKKG